MGGLHGAAGPDAWGNSALEFAPSIRHVLWANYNGGWEAGASLPNGADDHGRFLALAVVPHELDSSNRRFAEGREVLLARGYNYHIGTYEGGPGYGLPGSVTEENVEAESQVMKSLAAGPATLDSYLNGYQYGMRLQNFFTFSRGRNFWTSHAKESVGGHPYPSWLVVELFNTQGLGDFLITAAKSMPTWDLPGEQGRGSYTDAPMAACYATRDGDRFNVFVLSRIMDDYPQPGHDGYIPVTLHLPFDTVTGITLHKLAGDPRAHNLDSYAIQLEQVDIPVDAFSPEFVLNAARGADARGLPPAATFLYVFEGVSGIEPHPAPALSIFPASGQGTPTLHLPLRFTVLASEPVEELTASDITFGGSAPVTSYRLIRESSGAGSVYTIEVSSISATGTVVPQILAGACLGANTGQPSVQATYEGEIVAYEPPANGGVIATVASADTPTRQEPVVDDIFQGSDGVATLYGSPGYDWSQVMYLRFPVVKASDRTITQARLPGAHRARKVTESPKTSEHALTRRAALTEFQ